ncbi:ATP-binding protein [Candidatus Aerophobetes bacterium]|nr:ATP-binding protein [Candidatus Aerophobetes bacterium]
MLHPNTSKPFLGKYSVSKKAHRGLNKGTFWTKRDICTLTNFKELRCPHISFSLTGSGKRFSGIQPAKRSLGSPFVPNNHFTGNLSSLVFSEWVLFGLTFTQDLYLITNNLIFANWTELFHDQRLTGALLDRMTYHIHIVQIEGESYPFRQTLTEYKLIQRDVKGKQNAPS